MTIFGFTKTETVRYTALAELFRAMMAFITYFSYIKFNLGKKLNSRKIAISALTGFLMFHLITYSWPFLPGQLLMYNNDGNLNLKKF